MRAQAVPHCVACRPSSRATPRHPHCQATPSTLDAPSTAPSAERSSSSSGMQAVEWVASSALAGPHPAATGSWLRGREGLHGINLGPGGVLTSALVAKATGTGTDGQKAAAVEGGYHPTNRIAYQASAKRCLG